MYLYHTVDASTVYKRYLEADPGPAVELDHCDVVQLQPGGQLAQPGVTQLQRRAVILLTYSTVQYSTVQYSTAADLM